jgi:hypothetical protein
MGAAWGSPGSFCKPIFPADADFKGIEAVDDSQVAVFPAGLELV